MEPNKPLSDNSPTTNNSNILLEVVNNLTQLKNSTQDELMIKGLDDAINKINGFLGTYNQQLEEISKKIESADNAVNIVKEEIKYEEGKYVGQVSNGLPEGKGESLFDNGDKYEGECKDGKAEGKGIKQWINGDKYEGEYKKDRRDGGK